MASRTLRFSSRSVTRRGARKRVARTGAAPKPITLPDFDFIVAITYYDAGWDVDWADVIRVTGRGSEVKTEVIYSGPLYSDDYRKAMERAEKLGVPVYDDIALVFEKVEAFKWAKRFLDLTRERRCPLCGRRLRTYRVRREYRKTEPPIVADPADDLLPYDVDEHRAATCFHCNVRYEWIYWTEDRGAVLNWKFVMCIGDRCFSYAKTGMTNSENVFNQYLTLLRELARIGLVRFE
jgi:hypothetical protein